MTDIDGPLAQIGWTPEAGDRLDKIIARVGGLSAAARIAGKSDDALMRWRRGDARWDCWSIARLCAVAGRSLDWVVFGEEAPAGTGRLHQETVLEAADFVLRAAATFPSLTPEDIARSILRRAAELDGVDASLTDGRRIGEQYPSR